MRIYTKAEFEKDKDKLIAQILDGAVFIYPTDTIYGIGCNAMDEKAVKEVRTAKGNFSRPVSVIAPDKDWIMENCEITGLENGWLDKLPGPYTLIMNKKKDCIAKNVTPNETVGIRIPDHWCKKIASETGVPIVTTSANLTGDMFMTSLDNLSDEVKKHVDFMIDEGVIDGRPSTIVHLYDDEIKVVER